MTRTTRTQTVLAIAMALTAVSARAQQPAPAPATDPAAVAALDRMATYLRTLKVYEVQASTTTDDVLDNGQTAQYTAAVRIVVQMPDKLWADVTSDQSDRTYVFDGKTFTLWGRRVGYYSTFPAPATVRELADSLSEKYDIEIPLVDLFLWGAPGWNTAALTGARDIGPDQVNGTTCQHYVFRQDGIDWQVWIQKGDFPLPRKLVVTTTTDPARPQHSAVYTWNLAPSVNDGMFTFKAPKGANKVPLVPAAQ